MTKAQISRKLAAWLAVYGEPPIVEIKADGTMILRKPMPAGAAG
ncbi:hypothetical protein ACLGGT_07030 [Roseovarius sp. MS2]|tara:strand:- start:373 stop:504 length:132 start_codon:yes stop_codon:yes gene_type:complete